MSITGFLSLVLISQNCCTLCNINWNYLDSCGCSE